MIGEWSSRGDSVFLRVDPMVRPRSSSLLFRFVRLIVRAGLAGLLALLAANAWVVVATWPRTHAVPDAPHRTWTIVLGASVYGDEPSPILTERLETAAELWRHGRTDRILVSGDRSPDRHYDEVGVMARELERLGVPRADITVDGDGYRTLDSMWRAAHLLGIRDALVVTNPFHLGRAVYLARQFGIEADGVSADRGMPYSTGTRAYNQLRELLARPMALVDVHLLATAPEVTVWRDQD